MKSMTGFGHGTATGTKGIVTAEIKTVNNRFHGILCHPVKNLCYQRTGTPGQDIR